MDEIVVLLPRVRHSIAVSRNVLVARVERNLSYCGTPVDKEICVNSECDYEGNDVTWKCNIRMCSHPKCVERREVKCREILKPHFDSIKNLVVFTLTFAYEKIDFMDDDFVSKCNACIDSWVKVLHDQFHYVRFVVNTDIVKKPNGKMFIHYNVACDCLDENLFIALKDRNSFSSFQLWCRSVWRKCSAVMADGSYHISVEPKRYPKQIKKALDYFVMRTAHVNKKEKKHPYIPITPLEYVRYFYKKHFIRYRYSNFNEGCKLVLSSNIDKGEVEKQKVCPRCGHKFKLLSEVFGVFIGQPPPIEDYISINVQRDSNLFTQKTLC